MTQQDKEACPVLDVLRRLGTPVELDNLTWLVHNRGHIRGVNVRSRLVQRYLPSGEVMRMGRGVRGDPYKYIHTEVYQEQQRRKRVHEEARRQIAEWAAVAKDLVMERLDMHGAQVLIVNQEFVGRNLDVNLFALLAEQFPEHEDVAYLVLPLHAILPEGRPRG